MEQALNEQQFEGLQSANTYIVKLITGIDMYFEYIKEEKDDDASNLLSYIVEGIDWINDIIRLTKDIQKEEMDEEVMKKYLSELEEFFNNGSTDEASKILKEKILSLLNEWKNIISSSISV